MATSDYRFAHRFLREHLLVGYGIILPAVFSASVVVVGALGGALEFVAWCVWLASVGAVGLVLVGSRRRSLVSWVDVAALGGDRPRETNVLKTLLFTVGVAVQTWLILLSYTL